NGASPVHRDGEGDAQVVALGGARDGGQLQVHAVAEHHVAGERGAGQVVDAGLVAGGAVVDLAAEVLGQGELRGHEAAAGRGGLVEAGEHLEVHVGPAAVIAAGEHCGERHRPVGTGLLHPAQVVLVGGRVERVPAVLVRVPQVEGRSGEGGTVTGVDDGEVDAEGEALGGAGVVTEAGPDVGAHDAALGQH